MPNLKRKRGDNNGSDDDEPSFGRQILPVANLPDTFDGIPSDGMEYLFTVRCVSSSLTLSEIQLAAVYRRDAFLLPHITRVENPYQTEEFVLPPPRSLEVTHPSIPSAEWRSLFEIRFRNLRKAGTWLSREHYIDEMILERCAIYRYSCFEQQDSYA